MHPIGSPPAQWTTSRGRNRTGEKRPPPPLCCRFLHETRWFTKTDSGQTYYKTQKNRAFHTPRSYKGPINSTGPLVPSMMPPIRITESFPALTLRKVLPPVGGNAAVPASINCAPTKLAFSVPECEHHNQNSACGPPRNDPPCCGPHTAGTLACKSGGTIKDVTFAAFGKISTKISGELCSGFEAAGCHADLNATLAMAKAACVGKSECSFNATMALSNGKDPCRGIVKALAVEATGCEAALPPDAPPAPPSPSSDKPVRWQYDFGQNVNGFVSLSLPSGHNLPAGTQIRLEHGEITHEDSDGGDTYVPPQLLACVGSSHSSWRSQYCAFVVDASCVAFAFASI